MKAGCKTAVEALAESPLAGLIDKARVLEQATAAIAAISNGLNEGNAQLPVPTCAFHGRTLVINVESPSHAAKLRQCAIRIERFFRENHPELTGFRIRLQPGGPDSRLLGIASPAGQAASGSSDRGDLPAALRFADELVQGLRDSPLRRSALRLQSSLRSKRSGTG